MGGALSGLKVVDFSRVLAGPHCAKTLLDLGASVTKIEPPATDFSRMAYPRIGEISGYYAQQNAGKRNVSINLNVPGTREIALRMCDQADVIIENFRPRNDGFVRIGLRNDCQAQSSGGLRVHLGLRSARKLAVPHGVCAYGACGGRHYV